MRYRAANLRRLIPALVFAAMHWSAAAACAQTFYSNRAPDAVIGQSIQMADEPAPRLMAPAQEMGGPILAPPSANPRVPRSRLQQRTGGLREFFAAKRQQIEAEEAEAAGQWSVSGGGYAPYEVGPPPIDPYGGPPPMAPYGDPPPCIP